MKDKGKNSERKRTLKWSIARAGMAVLLVSIAIAVTVLTVTPVVAQEAEVTVTVKAPEYVGEGETFDVTIDVDSVTDFNSAQFNLSFDPSVVEATNVTGGHIDDTGIPIYNWDYIESGTITVISGFPEKVDTKVSGTGYLANITFEVIGEEGDECVLEISNEKLVKIVKTDKGMDVPEEIPAECIDAELKVGEEGEGEEEEEEEGDEPTPTPSTSPTPTNVTNVTDVTNVTATSTPTLTPGVTPTPEAKGTPTPTPKEKTTPKPTAPPTGEKPTPTPTPTPKAPGFEAIFAIAVVGIAYILLRKR